MGISRGPAAVQGMVAAGLLVLGSGPAAASTYYVNIGSSSCSNAGPGTTSQPYCTISAALAAHHSAGTTIVVRPGTYRETVTIPASGSSTSPLVIQGQGLPVVTGADDFARTSLWQRLSGDVWRASSVTWSPRQVLADSVRLKASTASPSSLPGGSFEWVSGQGLYVNVGGDNPGNHHLEVGHRADGFYMTGRSWITVDGFLVTRSEQHAFRLTDLCSHVTVTDNVVRLGAMWGIMVEESNAVRVASCTVSDNGYHGIGLTAGTTASTVENNESFRNAYPPQRLANGLYCYGATSNQIRGNRFHDNQDTGLHLGGASNDNICLENRSWNNGDHGYDNLHSTGNVHIGDVAWDNHKDGFSIEGTSTGTTLFDCIAVDNGLSTNEFDLWVDQASAPGFVSNDNLFWNSTSQAPVKFITTLYASVAIYSKASGQDTRTIQADPRFANPSAGDFHLLAGSPAIDSGNSGVANWPSTDAEGDARVDDPSTRNTGRGPITYADRGALEYRPPAAPAEIASTGPPAVEVALAPARIAPNPVRGTAVLTFGMQRPGQVTVRIFDVSGRLVTTALDGFLGAAGMQAVPLATRSQGGVLEAGMYFYEIRAEDRREMGRFVVLR